MGGNLTFEVHNFSGYAVGEGCDNCTSCANYGQPGDAGTFCDLRDDTPTCKNISTELPSECVDCIDNDEDGLIDYQGLYNNGTNKDDICSSFTYISESIEEEDPGEGVIPEFSTIGVIVAVGVVLVIVAVMRKKKN